MCTLTPQETSVWSKMAIQNKYTSNLQFRREYELPLVSVIIPTYNRKEILSREIESIIASDYPKDKLEIIVVDDYSSDETHKYIAQRFPSIIVLRNNDERGLAGSRNVGIKAAKGNYILIVDDDNIFDAFAIRELVNTLLQNETIGIVGPAMYYYKEPSRIWCMGIRRSYTTSLTKFLGRDQQNSKEFADIIESEDFPNAFMVRRQVIERIGLLDETTFLIHYDEADFGIRCRRAGYRVACVPQARIWHDIPLPGEVRDKARLFHCQNEFRAYHCGRNRVVFHKRYSTPWQFLIFISIFNWIISLYYVRIILLGSQKPLRERLKIATAYIKGALAGITSG